MRTLIFLALTLVVVPPASAVPLQDLLVPGAALDAGRLHFTDFHAFTDLGVDRVSVSGLPVGGLSFNSPDFEASRHRPIVSFGITFVASASAGINGFTLAADELDAIPGTARASLSASTEGVAIGLPECFFPFVSCPSGRVSELHAFRQIPPASSVPVSFGFFLEAGPENPICGGCIGGALVINPNITFAIPEPGSAWIGGAGMALLVLLAFRKRVMAR